MKPPGPRPHADWSARVWLRDWGGIAALIYTIYLAGFALWMLAGQSGTQQQIWIGDLAPLPTYLLMLPLVWRVGNLTSLGPATRRAWRLIALAYALNGLGDVLWAVIELEWGTPPFPSWADIPYVAYYPVLLLGLLAFPARSNWKTGAGRLALDSLTVLIASGMVIWYVALHPVAEANGSDPGAALLALAYPSFDMVLLFGAIRLILNRPREIEAASVWLLIGSVLLFVVSDVLFARLALEQTYTSGTWPDLPWMVARWMVALAAQWQFVRAGRATPERTTADAPSRAVSLLPYVAVLLGYALLFVAAADSWRGVTGGLLAGAGCLTAVVIARQVLVLRENRRLLDAADALTVELRDSEERYRRMALNANDLLAEVLLRRRELQDLVGRLLTSQEEERRRVAYELHDGVAQVIASAHQHLQAYAAHARPRDPERRAQLEGAVDLARRAVRETRRVVDGLRPTVLDDFGLAAALRHEVNALTDDGWDVAFSESLGDERLPSTMETALFRVVQEAIAIARRHDGERIHIVLMREPRGLRLEVRELPPASALEPSERGDEPDARLGFSSMQERVSLLGGSLRIEGGGDAGAASVVVIVSVPERGAGTG